MATFAVTGIRLGEAVALSVASLDGPPGERRLTVVGKGDQARALPLYPALEAVLEAYLASRATRFPDHDLAGPPLPCSSTAGPTSLRSNNCSATPPRTPTRRYLEATANELRDAARPPEPSGAQQVWRVD